MRKSLEEVAGEKPSRGKEDFGFRGPLIEVSLRNPVA